MKREIKCQIIHNAQINHSNFSEEKIIIIHKNWAPLLFNKDGREIP